MWQQRSVEGTYAASAVKAASQRTQSDCCPPSWKEKELRATDLLQERRLSGETLAPFREGFTVTRWRFCKLFTGVTSSTQESNISPLFEALLFSQMIKCWFQIYGTHISFLNLALGKSIILGSRSPFFSGKTRKNTQNSEKYSKNLEKYSKFGKILWKLKKVLWNIQDKTLCKFGKILNTKFWEKNHFSNYARPCYRFAKS